ncbi:hypothetical protein [Streptomyces sp. SS1-1]|uniref:hypothetical protein n=1 Tax=Streptomyces sp. SS1-1 TaxID=2651869 RepID=UPI00178C7336|nr:hypothetical protein [Streptomyces sp. SS1-1]
MTHPIPVPLPYAFVDHHAVGLAGKGIDGRAVTYGADPWRLLPLHSPKSARSTRDK